ncbi:MAG: T9SS type A sorting domain-containing protein [Bacteroidia bacterium]|nr:T9SS type A sorting domain-containing protein [Bacteroidia bacterium]
MCWHCFNSGTPTGIQPNEDESKVTVYPNPASSLIYITVDDFKTTGVLKFYDMLGQEVKNVLLLNPITIVNTDDLNNGLYIITAGKIKRPVIINKELK